jgi:hypothetical protein
MSDEHPHLFPPQKAKIVAPEILLQRALSVGFADLINPLTPGKIEELFKGYSDANTFGTSIIDDVKAFLFARTNPGQSPVKIAVNFPRSPISYPHVAIVLAGAQEDQEHDVLDDYIEDEEDETSSNAVEVHGIAERQTFNILILSQDANLTLYLWIIVKAILVLNRVEFTRRGMQNILYGGNDVALDPTQFPEFAYGRMVTLSCLTYFRVPDLTPSLLITDLTGPVTPTAATIVGET